MICLLFLMLVLTGCGQTASLSKDGRKLPDTYIGIGRNDTASIAEIEWNRFFPDTILQEYIQIAIDNNYSFRNALERINMARNETLLRKGSMFPSVSAGVNVSSERFGRYTMDGVGNSTTNTPDLPSEFHIPDPYRDFSIGIGFRWEADIWGRLNQKRKAAVYRWMASVEAARLAQSYLIQDLANNYFDLIGLDYQREVIIECIGNTERSLNLTYQLKQEGEETQLAVDRFDARLLKLKGLLIENEARIKATERAISLLMGVLPRQIKRISFENLTEMTFPVEIGRPEQLLEHRPDIIIAEKELDAANCDAASAKRSFYPMLTLGGSAGFNAFDVAAWFISPASLVYNVMAGLTSPVFNGNEIRTQYRNAQSRQVIALNEYFRTILEAYQEVVGVVTEIELTERHKRLKEKEILNYQKATENAKELFQLQYINYIEVLSAEEEFYNSHLDYIDVQTRYCKLHVDLYRALGGGTDMDIDKSEE